MTWLDLSIRVVLLLVAETCAGEIFFKALSALEQKFKTIKNGKGIAYTIPLTGTIGVAIYRFLSNTPA